MLEISMKNLTSLTFFFFFGLSECLVIWSFIRMVEYYTYILFGSIVFNRIISRPSDDM